MNMISILSRSISVLVVAGLLLNAAPAVIYAQPSLTLSVTPTKFDVRALPGQSWTSEIRVINSNSFELAVFAQVVNFVARGDGGEGEFVPVLEDGQGQTFAEWISVPATEIRIAPEQSGIIPLTVTVPAEAPPGGHYAAVLISTQPPTTDAADSQVRTTQAVTSLFFLKVDGDIVESGTIREFTTSQTLYRSPDVQFTVRFENRGNVHIQPRGDITIFNMWGEERGLIPINQRSAFGDVLPEQVRRFTFGWTGEWSLADIGRYEAVVNVAYGEQSRQFASSRTYFWVLPWHWVLGVLVGLGAFVGVLIWAVRLYIRRMLVLSGIDPEVQALRSHKTSHRQMRVSVTAPIEVGLLDLRSRLEHPGTASDRAHAIWQFIMQYRKFFLVVVVILIFTLLLIGYVQQATVDRRSFEVRIDQTGETLTVPADEEVLPESINPQAVTAAETAPPVAVVNYSGVTGAAARIRVQLEALGYDVVSQPADQSAVEARTFIVYGPRYKEAALALSQALGNVLISAYGPADDAAVPITIYVGADSL